MADPLTAFGAAASALQIVDVALRTSREIYEFLNAFRHAKKEILILRETLQDVESNVRTLRHYIYAFKQSRKSKVEYQVLPEAVTGTITRFADDIVMLKALLPRQPSSGLARSLQWVSNKSKIDGMIRRLNDRKIDLVLALSLIGRLDDLQRVQHSADLSQSLSTTQETILHHQQSSQATLLEHIHSLGDSIRAEAEQRQQECTNSSPSPIRQRQGHMRDRTHQPPQILETELLHLNFDDTSTASSTDAITSIFRNELNSTLKAVIEEVHTNSGVRLEAALGRAETLVDRMSHEFGSYVSRDLKGDDVRLTTPASETSEHDSMDSDELQLDIDTQEQAAYNISRSRQTWLVTWTIGSLQVDVQRTTSRKYGSPDFSCSTSIYVHFRPTANFHFLPGVSMFYSTSPNQRGFYQLAPMINVFPILTRGHPIKMAILHGDLPLLKELLSSMSARLNFQDEFGGTLLHYAAFYGKPDICQFLVSYGLKWDTMDRDGFTPLHDAAMAIFFRLSSLADSVIPMKDIIATLEMIEEAGGDFGELGTGALRWKYQTWELAEDLPVRQYSEGIKWLSSRCNTAVWGLHFTYWEDSMFHPTRKALSLMEQGLSSGLDPNTAGLKSSRPLLVRVLDSVSLRKKDKRNLAEETVPDEGISPWSTIRALIQGGANIYYQSPHSVEGARTWLDINTPWTYAIGWDVEPEWCAALRECGLEPDDIFDEDIRRCKQEFRLGGARRTAVDEEELELPSVSGIRCRRCRRKRCVNGHDHGVF